MPYVAATSKLLTSLMTLFPNRSRCGCSTSPTKWRNDSYHRYEIEEESRELSITDEFPFTRDSDKSPILRLAAAKGPLLAPLQARRAQNLALTVMLAAIAGAVVIGVTRLFAGGVRRVGEAVEH